VAPGREEQREGADRQENVTERTDDLLLRVGRGEGQDERAERHGDEDRAEQVGPQERGCPAAGRDPGEDDEQQQRGHPDRCEHPRLPDEGNERDPQGDVGDEPVGRPEGEHAQGRGHERQRHPGGPGGGAGDPGIAAPPHRR